MMGWDEGLLQEAVDTCTNPSGRIQDCSKFTLQSLQEEEQCQMSMPHGLSEEKVDGLVGDGPPAVFRFRMGPAPQL